MPFEGFRITSPFGQKRGSKTHKGIDIVKNHKDPIGAFVGGEVIYAGFGKAGTGLGGYGNVVVVKDEKGKGHVYGHLDSISVSKGMFINKGQIIGRQGNTGDSNGSHLHYEVRNNLMNSYGVGTQIDPSAYLKGFGANGEIDSGATSASPSSFLEKTYFHIVRFIILFILFILLIVFFLKAFPAVDTQINQIKKEVIK